MGTGSSPGVKIGWGVVLTPHPLLVPWSWKGRAIPLLPLWAVRTVRSLSACTRVYFIFHLLVLLLINNRPLKMGLQVVPKRRLLTTSQKSEDLIYATAEAWNRRHLTHTGKFLSRWPIGQKSVPDEARHVIDCSSRASKSCVPSVYLSGRKSRRHVSGRTATGDEGHSAPAHEKVQPHAFKQANKELFVYMPASLASKLLDTFSNWALYRI